MIETRLLYYFLAIAREQNITKAAQFLHVTQPTLSKQLMDLEENLGKKLIIRGNRKITLTEEGIFFRTRAQEIVNLLEKAESAFQEASTQISGDVYVGAAESPHMDVISKIMVQIQKEHPNVHFHLTSGMAEDIIDHIDKGLLDFALLIEPANYERYNYEKLPLEHNLGLLIRKDSDLFAKESISFEDLRPIPFIFPNQAINDNRMVSWFGGDLKSLNIVSTYNLIYNASFLVEQGMGSAFCIANLVNLHGRNLTFRPFEPPLTGSMYLVSKKYQTFSPAAKLFRTRLIEDLE